MRCSSFKRGNSTTDRLAQRSRAEKESAHFDALWNWLGAPTAAATPASAAPAKASIATVLRALDDESELATAVAPAAPEPSVESTASVTDAVPQSWARLDQ